MSNLIPDILPALKSWIIALDLVGNRVWYRLPAKPNAAPFVRLSRSGGGLDMNSEVPVSTITALVEFWGLQNSDYEAVRAAALGLEQAVHDVAGPTKMGADTSVLLLAANVISGMDSPDPDNGFPRYVLAIRVTARSA